MLTETGLFWLGLLAFGVASSFFTSSIRSFRTYKSATKPKDALVRAYMWFVFGFLLTLFAIQAWQETAVAAYLP